MVILLANFQKKVFLQTVCFLSVSPPYIGGAGVGVEDKIIVVIVVNSNVGELDKKVR